ncbi:hypothetical protein NC652_025368 [Populus alba x Populus x berolinensis]|nr:hypothetical protein NC652_025368 [Populus alba x Populus x berolinensis]
MMIARVLTANKANLMVSEIDCQQEEKFQIDMMAPPSSSSPERDSEIDFVAVDPKSMVTYGETEKKPVMVKEDEKALKVVKEDINVEPVEKKTKVTGEEVESQKPLVNKERNIDLQLDLGKADRDSATVTTSRNKLLQHVQPQPNTEKIAQSSSLPLPMSMTGWPGGLPHMGYMAPLQGVLSMDGSTLSSAAIQLPHSLPHQQRQQMQSQTVSPQARQLESELGGEDSPSTADSQVSRPNTSLYGQNLMPIHPANFALMNPTPMGGAHSASGNTSEKKPRQPQTQVSKAGAEPSASQAFAMSFTSINGTTASRDLIFLQLHRIMLFSKASQRQQGMDIT